MVFQAFTPSFLRGQSPFAGGESKSTGVKTQKKYADPVSLWLNSSSIWNRNCGGTRMKRRRRRCQGNTHTY
jgi:hypothetical protein